MSGLGQGSRFCTSVWLPPTDYKMGAVGPWIILKSLKTLSLWFLKQHEARILSFVFILPPVNLIPLGNVLLL